MLSKKTMLHMYFQSQIRPHMDRVDFRNTLNSVPFSPLFCAFVDKVCTLEGNMTFAGLTHIELDVSVVLPCLLELPVVGGDGQQLPLSIVHELRLPAGDGLGTPPQGQV